MVELNNDDIILIRDYVIRESKDYTPNKDGMWIRKVVHQIIELVKKIEDGNYLIIKSYGSAGAQIRELRLDIYRRESTIRTNYIIHLCTCGALNHMVRMSKEKKNDK